jgi:hypothetical protein
MNVQYLLTQIVIHAAGGTLMLIISWYLLKQDLLKHFKTPAAVTNEESGTLLQLRLQAHERMIVFIERLNPANLFIRLFEQGVPAVELQARILSEVRNEYQHNVSQQLYINAVSWNVLCKLKDDTIAMINNAAATLPPDASGRDLSRVVLEHVAGIAENPYDLTIELIKQDIHQLF